MIAQRYSKNELNKKIKRTCFNCKGTGIFQNNQVEESCIICNGQGEIETFLELCPICNEVVPADNKILVHNKKVCFDCMNVVKKKFEKIKINKYNVS